MTLNWNHPKTVRSDFLDDSGHSMSLCCFVCKSKLTSTAILSFKKRFLFAAPSPVSRVQCSPEKMKTWKNCACSITSFSGTGRREPWNEVAYGPSMHHQWGRRNACVWQTWEGYSLEVLSWSSLNISVFWSFTKKMCLKQGEIWLKAKFLPRLSHKICRRFLSSPVLLRIKVS